MIRNKLMPLLLFVTVLNCFSQTITDDDNIWEDIDYTDDKKNGWGITVQTNPYNLNVFNKFIDTSGFLAPKDIPVNIGFLYYSHKRVVSLFDLGFWWNKKSKDTAYNRFNTFYFTYSLGVAAILTDHFILFPSAGINFRSFNYHYYVNKDNISLNNYLNAPYSDKYIRLRQWNLDLGINAFFKNSAIIGIRFGYLYPLHKLKIKIGERRNTTQVVNIPPIDDPYIYIGLSIGVVE
jgi:hypothetical protein